MFTVLIDNGHGACTPGKRSPDGKIREYAYTRALAAMIKERLDKAPGISCGLLVPEEEDVSLRERVRRANDMQPHLLVSLHINASGMGADWREARGWGAYVGPRANSGSLRAASALARAAEAAGLKVRRPAPGVDAWAQNLAICRDTVCSSVLTENLFMDNAEDCAFLLSPDGMRILAEVHAGAIVGVAY